MSKAQAPESAIGHAGHRREPKRRGEVCVQICQEALPSSTERMTMNASLRNFDVADVLHALLPAFCFSSSLRLRVMSPP